MTRYGEGEGISRNSTRRRRIECSANGFSFIHYLFSLLWPRKKLHIRDREEGANNNNIKRDRDEGANSNNINIRRDREEGANNNNINIRSKWSEIGDDDLCSILERLSPIDYLIAQTVCLSWQSTISRLITNKHGLPSTELPLLLFNKTNHLFFNLSTKSVFTYIVDSYSDSSSTTTFETKIYWLDTVLGWMVMIEQGFKNHLSGRRRVFFFNPVTKTKVYMPSTLGAKYTISKMIASTKPTDPNCVVVCLFRGTDSFAFSFMSDKSWTQFKGDGRIGFSLKKEAEISDGKLYVLTDETLNSIVVFDLREKPVKPHVLAKLPAITKVPITTEVDPRFENSVVYNAHGQVHKSLTLDTSSQELFLVYLLYNIKYLRGHVFSPPNITGSKVFKLDNIIASGEPKWVEVTNLKNRMLYVDSHRTHVISNIGVHGPKEVTQENCIYFGYKFRCDRIRSIEPSWRGIWIGRHCKIDGSMSYYKFETPDSVEVSPPMWFIPHLDG